MRNIVLYIAISLDGYIADLEGGVSFLEGDGSDSNALGTYHAFIKDVDTVIMGYETFRKVRDELSPNHWPYEDQMTYVFTKRSFEDETHIKYVNHPDLTWFNDIKKENGKDIFLCGGAKVFNLCHQLGVIDQYRIQFMPVILGEGIKLFNRYDFQVKLRLKDVITYNGMVEVIYEKRSDNR